MASETPNLETPLISTAMRRELSLTARGWVMKVHLATLLLLNSWQY